MFKKNDKEVDVSSLNNILKTGSRILNIGYFMAIVTLVLLGVYLIKELKILGIIKDLLIVISPLFIGFIIAWLFEPLVTNLQEKKVPRVAGCILVYLIIIGALTAIAYFFIPTLVVQVKDFVGAAPEIFDELSNFVVNFLDTINVSNIIDTSEIKNGILDFVSDFGMNIISDLPNIVLNIGKAVVSGGLNFVLGLMIGFYLLYDFNKVDSFVKNVIPNKWEKGYDELTTRINTSLRSYIQGVLVIMLLVFLTQMIGLTLAGMEAPIIFALFCAVTDIIPYFGPYIGGIPAVIVGFTISPITGVCVLISILVVQLLENNFYQPLIMGHTMKLHPVTIMLGLLIFQHFFGIIGMVIATPVIACIKVFAIFINEKINLLDMINGEEIVEEEKPIKKRKVIKKA